jgi:predicted metal-dependent peptidase
MNDPEIKKDIEENGKATKSLKEALENGDVKVDENGNLVDKDGNPVSVVPGPLDDHDGWDDMNEEDREFLKGKIKQAAQDAAKECDKKGSWGSIGAELRRDIRSALTKEINWKAILKQFCGLSKRADRSSSRMRLNKKYPGIHSGFKRGYTSSMAVYIDQSGSVGDHELELLFSELQNLAKHTEFTTFHFDTEVDDKSEATWRQGKTPRAHRTRCGGTCFKAPSKHAARNKGRFDGYLILTDGYAPDPGPSRLRRGWIITPDGTVQDWMKSSRDFVIKMKWPKVKSNAA